jgi:hypothetical protein
MNTVLSFVLPETAPFVSLRTAIGEYFLSPTFTSCRFVNSTILSSQSLMSSSEGSSLVLVCLPSTKQRFFSFTSIRLKRRN